MSSCVLLMSYCYIVASSPEEKLDSDLSVNSLREANEALRGGLDGLITDDEFKKIIYNKCSWRNHGIGISNVVYYVFLKKICSIDQDSTFWTLGGVLEATNGRGQFVFKKLALDSSSGDRKPVVQIFQDVEEGLKMVAEVPFDEVRTITFNIDNNAEIQGRILRDFYGLKGESFIITYMEAAESVDRLKYLFYYAKHEILNNGYEPENYLLWKYGTGNYGMHGKVYLRNFKGVDNPPEFDDVWSWEEAAKHGYERRTKLLWKVDFSGDYMKKLYKLCLSDDFWKCMNPSRKWDNTVDFYNFFPELLQPWNKNAAEKLVAKRIERLKAAMGDTGSSLYENKPAVVNSAVGAVSNNNFNFSNHAFADNVNNHAFAGNVNHREHNVNAHGVHVNDNASVGANNRCNEELLIDESSAEEECCSCCSNCC